MTAPAPDAIRWWTVSEIADYLRVSNMTIYRLIHTREIPAERIGRNFRIPDHMVAEVARRLGVTTTDTPAAESSVSVAELVVPDGVRAALIALGLDERTCELLTALGWTPPGEES